MLPVENVNMYRLLKKFFMILVWISLIHLLYKIFLKISSERKHWEKIIPLNVRNVNNTHRLLSSIKLTNVIL